MQSYFEIAREIIRYFNTTRQVGHTTATVEGILSNGFARARGVEPVIIVRDAQHARQIADTYNRKPHVSGGVAIKNLTVQNFVSLGSISMLQRTHAPTVIDHFALTELLSQMCQEYDAAGADIRETATKAIRDTQDKIGELLGLAEDWKRRALAAEKKLEEFE